MLLGRWYLRYHRKLFCEHFSNNAAKQLASAALLAGKTAAKDIGMKAIDVCKTFAIYSGKKLVEILLKSYTHQNHKWLMLWFHQKKLQTSKRSYSQVY